MEELYTVEEVANILKVHKITIYKWIKQHKINVIRVAERTTRIPKSELERLLSKEA